MQKQGVYVIPNVRWGDERTYTTKFPKTKFIEYLDWASLIREEK